MNKTVLNLFSFLYRRKHGRK